MTYHSPDPRYDYRKLDAFITGVNYVVPVQKRLLVKSMREDILLWAFPFARPIVVKEPKQPSYDDLAKAYENVCMAGGIDPNPIFTYQRDEHGVYHLFRKDGSFAGFMSEEAMNIVREKLVGATCPDV